MKEKNIPYFFDLISRKLFVLVGKMNLFRLAWWQVSIGSNSFFDGKVYINRFPKSQITIGHNCRFRSRVNSNQIGINRPCALNTQTSEAIIVIGNNCGFSGTVIGAFKHIEIGNNVKCGANTLITDSDWHLDDPRSGLSADVIIGDNVWLGEGVRVLKGVTIGANSVIGAGSIVTKDIPANVIAAGNPCKVIKNID